MTPEQERVQQALVDYLMRPDFKPITCPECDIRFGMLLDDLRFAEQTGIHVWCPNGHKLRTRIRKSA